MCSKLVSILVFLITALLQITVCELPLIIQQKEDFGKGCSEKTCIPKCCDKGELINQAVQCDNTTYDKKYNLEDFKDIYDINNYDKLVNKTLRDLFYLIPKGMYGVILSKNLTFEEMRPNIILDKSKLHLVENGSLFFKSMEQWTEQKYFCLDYVLKSENHIEPLFLVASIDTEDQIQSYYFYLYIMSSIFFVLVLLVYIILPELRNLGGMILMAYVTSLLFAFILLAIVQRTDMNKEKCIKITASLYFALLASFCWMSVMSLDIWWTFRGYAKARQIHRRGEIFKFYMYCLFAWGMPAAMTMAFVIINETDLSHIPWFITPDIPEAGCFLSGKRKMVYVYIPIMILLLCNLMFFFMTAYNIRRLTNGTAILDSAAAGNPAAHRQQKARLMVYWKLFAIMGINWLLEVVSYIMPVLTLWQITDTYNLLIGFAIFLIFVCKKSIYNKLLARFQGFSNRPVFKTRTSTPTISSNKNLI